METGLVNLLFEAVDLVQLMVGNLDKQESFSAEVKSLEKSSRIGMPGLMELYSREEETLSEKEKVLPRKIIKVNKELR